jgi:hypothetical protein
LRLAEYLDAKADELEQRAAGPANI